MLDFQAAIDKGCAMREQLSLARVRHAPLLRGPYISLSQGFRVGASVADLIGDQVFHPHLRQIIPEHIEHVYRHQERAFRAIHDPRTTLVSTGTGSGKTECFLYPIISKYLELRDAAAPPGISAVIVYPMNALAEDQLDRLRGLLAGAAFRSRCILHAAQNEAVTDQPERASVRFGMSMHS